VWPTQVPERPVAQLVGPELLVPRASQEPPGRRRPLEPSLETGRVW